MSQSYDNAINILLLGETGAGKSTTLNALANYLNYGNNYNESLSSELSEVIPTQFILPDPKTGAPFTIRSRSHANERQKAGASATIAPISYMFNYEQNKIRVIDTPGIGDTAGTQVDNENFEQILLHLQTQQMLNAIVFIVKNSDARMTAHFRYCISQLLLRLHKSVTQNILFCFTHSRSYMFGPGDGFRTLQTFLDIEYKEANLKLVPGLNCFFIDNDWYRILIAKRLGYPQDDDTELGCRSSYKKSGNQFEKMLQSIIILPPHNLVKTVSLNQARNIIRELILPMIEMQTTIKNNEESYNQSRYIVNEELKNELISIQEICAKLGCLLNNNSYFNLIDEKIKKGQPNVELLKRLKTEHEDRVFILTDSIKHGKESPVLLEDIPAFKQQLLNLKHNGENFLHIFEINERIRRISSTFKRDCKML